MPSTCDVELPELPGGEDEASDGPRLTVGPRCAAWRGAEIEPVDPALHSAVLDERIANEALGDAPVVLAIDRSVQWDRVAEMLDVLQPWGGTELDVLGANGAHLAVTQVGATPIRDSCVKASVELALDGAVINAVDGSDGPCPTLLRESASLDWNLVAETVAGRISRADPGCDFVVVGAELDRPWSEVALALAKVDGERVFATTLAPSLSCRSALGL